MIDIQITYKDQDDTTCVIWPLHANFAAAQLPPLDRDLLAVAMRHAASKLEAPAEIKLNNPTLSNPGLVVNFKDQVLSDADRERLNASIRKLFEQGKLVP